VAANCPQWRSGRCIPPGATTGSDCSWPGRDYDHCCVYGTFAVRSRGGSMADAVSFQNAWLREVPPLRGTTKRWWQFWK
jgi:hypothetical protein